MAFKNKEDRRAYLRKWRAANKDKLAGYIKKRSDKPHKLGQTRFFNGKPCPQGHVAERYVRDGLCVICCAEKLRRKREAKRDPTRIRLKAAQEAARAAGENTFWIDKPCVHGHMAPRRVENGGCCAVAR
jgi:hypothetical protein